MKRFLSIISIFIVLLIPVQVHASPSLAGSAQAAILMDRDSGRILFAKNADQELKIASLTKIMTAIVALEQSNPNSIVTVGPHAVGVEGSSIYLKQGEKIPLINLLYGLMLRSGNDAAVAIAEHVGGSVNGFVYLMNQKANFLGMSHTHFMNPNGLDQPGHYSSAKDLAILTSYALRNPTFREIVKTQVKTVDWPGLAWDQKFYNKNKLLRMYPWADGVKTGFTKQARRTLVTSATKNGQQLVAVTLNDGNDWQDAIDMYNYGFSHFHKKVLMKKGELLGSAGVKNKKGQQLQFIAARSFAYPLTPDEEKQITIKLVQSIPVKFVQTNKQNVGVAKLYLNGQPIGAVPLLSKFRPMPTILEQWGEIAMEVMAG